MTKIKLHNACVVDGKLTLGLSIASGDSRLLDAALVNASIVQVEVDDIDTLDYLLHTLKKDNELGNKLGTIYLKETGVNPVIVGNLVHYSGSKINHTDLVLEDLTLEERRDLIRAHRFAV
jgi:hypothetical protein